MSLNDGPAQTGTLLSTIESQRGRAVHTLYKLEQANGACNTFSRVMASLGGILGDDFLQFVARHSDVLDSIAKQGLEYDSKALDEFGLATLQRGYLLSNETVTELPAYMYTRCAVVACIGRGNAMALSLRQANRKAGREKPYINQEEVEDIERAIIPLIAQCATMLFERRSTFATPVLFNSGCRLNANLASCFLVAMTPSHDSVDGVFSTLHKCAIISSVSGGLGISMHDIRAKGTKMDSGQGEATGLLPVMRLFNEMSKNVDQGGGKRRGSCAVYLEPHHPDLITFLEARQTHGQVGANASNKRPPL
tara:strand:+ start:18336 stop:19259 length:924 start_codon:yes stop_codon:yes gene_type:complete